MCTKYAKIRECNSDRSANYSVRNVSKRNGRNGNPKRMMKLKLEKKKAENDWEKRLEREVQRAKRKKRQ